MTPNEVGQATPPAFRRASFCASGECIEVAQRDSMIILRDSAQPHACTLNYSARHWESFVRSIKSGKFNILEP
jgi:hypothetical protein